MKFTTKCKYGLQALLEIANQNNAGITIVKRKTITKNQNIPDSYLENILVLLKNGGLISSKRGLNGGYYLLKKTSEITLYEIIKILEGKSLFEECWSAQGDCLYKDKCKLRLIWEELQHLQEKLLKAITLSDLLNKENDCIPCFRENIQKKIKE